MTSTALMLATKKSPKKSPKKKPAAKKPGAKKKPPKPSAPEPTEAQLNAALDLSEEASELVADLDEASMAETVDEYVAALGAASTKLARVMRQMAALAAKVDPGAYAAAQARAIALPAAKPPALPQ